MIFRHRARRSSNLHTLERFTYKRSTNFQQLTNCLKFDYPMRIVVLSERSESKDLSSPRASTNFQQLTNCLKFATHSEPASYQRVTNCPICKSFVLITIQQYPGCGGAPASE